MSSVCCPLVAFQMPVFGNPCHLIGRRYSQTGCHYFQTEVCLYFVFDQELGSASEAGFAGMDTPGCWRLQNESGYSVKAFTIRTILS